MKFRAVFVVATLLATSWQRCVAAPDPSRFIEVAELHRAYDPVLLTYLDASPAVAARAALALGRIKNPVAAPALRASLTRPDTSVRAMAAYGLGLLDDVAALDSLSKLSRHDPNSAVRYAAIDAVGRIVAAKPEAGTLATATDVLIVARSDEDATVRAHAAAQMEAFHTASFASDIARALEEIVDRERDDAVRWHAAWALFRGFASHAGGRYLARALRDHSELVRVETLRALGHRADPHTAALIRPLLGDPSWRVQLEAREALIRLAKAAPTEHLVHDPPGLHLPAVPAQSVDCTGTAAASSANSAAPKVRAAPDPATFPLPVYAPPDSAATLNGPQVAKHPRVAICTTKGVVVVRLYPEWAPSTVANFVALAQSGYFDGNRWFRIVPDFVVQTGDPNDNGDGDAGYTIPAEENPVEQRSGVIAMGLNYENNKALRDSAGTQFYITLSPQLHLDRDFTVFGEVESGFPVLAHLVESDRMLRVRRIDDD